MRGRHCDFGNGLRCSLTGEPGMGLPQHKALQDVVSAQKPSRISKFFVASLATTGEDCDSGRKDGQWAR